MYQPADTMVSQQHLENLLMKGWYFNFKYQGGEGAILKILARGGFNGKG